MKLKTLKREVFSIFKVKSKRPQKFTFTVLALIPGAIFFFGISSAEDYNQRFLSHEQMSCYFANFDWKSLTKEDTPERVVYQFMGGTIGHCLKDFRFITTRSGGALKPKQTDDKGLEVHGIGVESVGGIECVQSHFKVTPEEATQACPSKVKVQCGGGPKDPCKYVSQLGGTLLDLQVEKNARIRFLEPRGGDPAAVDVVETSFGRAIPDYKGLAERREERRGKERLEESHQRKLEAQRARAIEKHLWQQLRQCRTNEDTRPVAEAALERLIREFDPDPSVIRKEQIALNSLNFKDIINEIDSLGPDDLEKAAELAEKLELVKADLPKGKDSEQKIAEAYLDIARKISDSNAGDLKSKHFRARERYLKAALRLKSNLKDDIRNEIASTKQLETESRVKDSKHPGSLFASVKKLGKDVAKDYRAACRGRRLQDSAECQFASERKDAFLRFRSEYIPSVRADGMELIREGMADRVSAYKNRIYEQQYMMKQLMQVRQQAMSYQNPLLWSSPFLAGSSGLMQDPFLQAGIHGGAFSGGYGGLHGGLDMGLGGLGDLNGLGGFGDDLGLGMGGLGGLGSDMGLGLGSNYF